MSHAIEPFQILRDELIAVFIGLIALVPNLVAGLLALVATWFVARYLSRAVRRLFRQSHLRPSLGQAMHALTKTGIWIIGVGIAATILIPNLTPTKLIAGLGLGSLAVGLAFKDIFENFLAGVLILLRQPMRVGDDIECEGVSGRVEKISLRETYLRKRSGELVLLPNSFVFKNPVMVLTDQPKRRIALEVGVAYGTDLGGAHAVMRGAVEGLGSVDATQKVDVFVTGFGESSVDFVIRWWAGSTPIEELISRDEVATALMAGLDAAGIEIPFPNRTLSFREPLEIGRVAPPAGNGDARPRVDAS